MVGIVHNARRAGGGRAPPSFKVVVTDQVFPSTTIEESLLGEIGAHLEIADGSLADVLSRGADADALLNTYFPISASTVEALERCRVIARYGIGVDNIDIAAANVRGIVVTNVPDYSVEEVAAHAVAMMLALLRKLPAADRYVRSGGWSIDALRPIRRISSLTLGLVGFGRIGRQVAQIAASMGMAVLVHDPYVSPPGLEPVSLDELLSRSDVVSLHAPLTPETRGLIGAKQLQAMGEHAILINTSRGGLVVLEDLVEALRSGSIAGAGIDVFDQEPVSPNRVADVPGLLVTPHMAYYSEEALAESQRKAATQVAKVLTGQQPDYPVRPAS